MVCSHNEWSPLKQCIVGTTTNMYWFKENKPVDKRVVEYSNKCLDKFARLLTDFGVEVLRPVDIDYASKKSFGAYSVRDVTLIIGKKVIFTPTQYFCRRVEWDAVKPLLEGSDFIYPPEDSTVMFDAANVIKCNYDILYQVSESGNKEGGKWLQQVLGNDYTVHFLEGVYDGFHLDTTILPLREGLVMLNSERVRENILPSFLQSWDKIWIESDDLEETPTTYPQNGSKWMGMNVFSVDGDNVIMSGRHKKIHNKLKRFGIEVHPCELPLSFYLMGGHHCTTLDTIRLET